MIESNPGPGLGLLLAYCVAGKGSARPSAAGTAIIQFVGGIQGGRPCPPPGPRSPPAA